MSFRKNPKSIDRESLTFTGKETQSGYKGKPRRSRDDVNVAPKPQQLINVNPNVPPRIIHMAVPSSTSLLLFPTLGNPKVTQVRVPSVNTKMRTPKPATEKGPSIPNRRPANLFDVLENNDTVQVVAKKVDHPSTVLSRASYLNFFTEKNEPVVETPEEPEDLEETKEEPVFDVGSTLAGVHQRIHEKSIDANFERWTQRYTEEIDAAYNDFCCDKNMVGIDQFATYLYTTSERSPNGMRVIW